MQQCSTATNIDAWADIVSGSFVPLEVDTAASQRAPFRGSVDHVSIGGIGLSTVRATAHTVERTPRLTQRGGGGLFKLSLQLSGTGVLLQDGREVHLRPGRLALYDTSRPYTLSFDRDFTSHVLMFPHLSLGVTPDDAAQLTATALDDDHHLGAAVTEFLRHAADVAPQLPVAVGARLAGNVVDLLGTLVAEILDVTPAHASPATALAAATAATGPIVPPTLSSRDELRARVLAHIDAHLDDPELSPASIAAAHYISVRGLHALFEGTGTTVAAHIRSRRLERCRDELADPGLTHRPVAVVGARWGFTDPAHFSRVFRAQYGISPGRFRDAGRAAA
ncbi:MAG: helix-turn-helix domain-containing protein [Micrococcus sp.]|nr:helix-turn-helix domain-containing protein [Micrococcus sp.]